MGPSPNLPQYHPVLRGPGAHQVQGTPSVGSVVAAPQRLPINGHHLSLGQLAHRLHPLGDAGGEPL